MKGLELIKPSTVRRKPSTREGKPSTLGRKSWTGYRKIASRRPLESRFGEIDIALDPAKGLLVDGFLVAQSDDGIAFCL